MQPAAPGRARRATSSPQLAPKVAPTAVALAPRRDPHLGSATVLTRWLDSPASEFIAFQHPCLGEAAPPPECPLSAEILESSQKMSWAGQAIAKASMKALKKDTSLMLSFMGNGTGRRFSDLLRLPKEGSQFFDQGSPDGAAGTLFHSLMSHLAELCTEARKINELCATDPLVFHFTANPTAERPATAYACVVSGSAQAGLSPLRLNFVLCEALDGSGPQPSPGMMLKFSAWQRPESSVKLHFAGNMAVGALRHFSLGDLCKFILGLVEEPIAVLIRPLVTSMSGRSLFKVVGADDAASRLINHDNLDARPQHSRAHATVVDWSAVASSNRHNRSDISPRHRSARRRSDPMPLQDGDASAPDIEEDLSLVLGDGELDPQEAEHTDDGDDDDAIFFEAPALDDEDGDDDNEAPPTTTTTSSSSSSASASPPVTAENCLATLAHLVHVDDIAEVLPFVYSPSGEVLPRSGGRRLGKVRVVGFGFLVASCSTHSRCTMKVDIRSHGLQPMQCKAMLWLIAGSAMSAEDHLSAAAAIAAARREVLRAERQA